MCVYRHKLRGQPMMIQHIRTRVWTLIHCSHTHMHAHKHTRACTHTHTHTALHTHFGRYTSHRSGSYHYQLKSRNTHAHTHICIHKHLHTLIHFNTLFGLASKIDIVRWSIFCYVFLLKRVLPATKSPFIICICLRVWWHKCFQIKRLPTVAETHLLVVWLQSTNLQAMHTHLMHMSQTTKDEANYFTFVATVV